jgi:hypothetical protein
MRSGDYKTEYLRYAREFSSFSDMAAVLNRSNSYVALRMNSKTDKHFSKQDIDILEVEIENRKIKCKGGPTLSEEDIEAVAEKVLELFAKRALAT